MEKQDTLTDLLMEIFKNSLQEEVGKIVALLSNSNSNEFPPYMKLSIASKYLDVSLNTLNKYIREGELSVIKIEGIKRIAKTDLDEFMQRHKY